MTVKLTIVLVIVVAVFIWRIVHYARRGDLALKYALPAIIAIVAVAAVVAMQPALTWLSSLLGVQSWQSTLLGIIAVGVAWVFVRLTVEITRLGRQSVRLAQDLAILAARADSPDPEEDPPDDSPKRVANMRQRSS